MPPHMMQQQQAPAVGKPNAALQLLLLLRQRLLGRDLDHVWL